MSDSHVLKGPFWDACRERKLVVQHCRACGAYQYPPFPMCGSCQNDALEWVTSSGRGVVHSASTVHRPQNPEFATPYVVAIVRMEEGWHMMSNVVGCDPAEVHTGLPVEVTFGSVAGVDFLPLFVPRSKPDAHGNRAE